MWTSINLCKGSIMKKENHGKYQVKLKTDTKGGSEILRERERNDQKKGGRGRQTEKGRKIIFTNKPARIE